MPSTVRRATVGSPGESLDFGDVRHLRALRDEYGDRVRGALLPHDGDAVERITAGVWAVPWWELL